MDLTLRRKVARLGHSITLPLFIALICYFIQQGVGPRSQKQPPEDPEKYSCFTLFAKFGKEVIWNDLSIVIIGYLKMNMLKKILVIINDLII